MTRGVNPVEGGQTQKSRRWKLVVEDSEADASDSNIGLPSIQDLQSAKKEGSHGKRQQRHQVPPSEPFNVPLFYDVRHYDSEADETEVEREEQGSCQRGTNKSQVDIVSGSPPETPSITILPPTPPFPDEYNEHCAELLELSSHHVTQFSEWSYQLSSHFDITKIAEASFGEVYRLSLLERLPGFSSSDESVFKIIALRPPEGLLPAQKRARAAALKKIENMSKPEDVANEVRLLQRMSMIPGFTNFRDVRVVQGRPPQPFTKAFKDYNVLQKARKKELSHFPDPAKKSSYPEDQLWAIVEMQDAGTDLEYMVENGQCSSIWSTWDIFWHVVLSLAKGEEGAEFEHRDLHLGNICVRQPPDADIQIDTKRKLNFTGLETTIIDYTISRAVMSDDTLAYHDLGKDSSLFEGDSTEEYQYDIYRYMRGMLFLENPYADLSPAMRQSERSWEQYLPITNLVWLHFILYKLLETGSLAKCDESTAEETES